ncbi:hypothetical protein ACVWWO_000470 [Bradyrhizobium sp. F1.13.1]
MGVCLPTFEKILAFGVAGDVVRHRERAVSSPAFGVHAPLRDHLAVEVGELLDQPDILQQGWAARSGGHDVGVIGDRRAGGIGKWFCFGHVGFLSVEHVVD